MTRRVSRTGRVYTEGSHATPESGFPTHCCRCGERIYTSREGFWHDTNDLTGEKTARHLPECPVKP